jgi:HK97 family phage prohead protease
VPWHITPDHAKCGKGKFAVVKDSDGSVAGCHPSKAAAKKQMAALYAKEPTASSNKEETMAERRFTLLPVEARAREGRRSIGGYAAVFNRLSQNLGGFVERVDPSFFNKSRGDGWPDVIARYNHDDAFLLGTTNGRTLRLSLDSTGLDYETDPPQARADILELVERGDIHKSSFAFRVYPNGDDWGLSEQGYPMRTLLSGQLVDVAPVTQPAYLDTEAGLRSLASRFEAEVEEVRSLAQANELRRFFVKTEAGKPVQKAKPRTFGPAAAATLLARKSDPWG